MHVPRFTAPPPPLPLGSVPAPTVPTVVPTSRPPPGPPQLSVLPPACHPGIKPPALNEPCVASQYYSNFHNVVSNPTFHPYGVIESFKNVNHHHVLPVDQTSQQEQSFCYAPVKLVQQQHCLFKTAPVAQFQRSEQPDIPSNCFSKQVEYGMPAASHYHPPQPNTSSSSVGIYQGNVPCNSFLPRYAVGTVGENIGNMLPVPEPPKYAYVTGLRQASDNKGHGTISTNISQVFYHTTPDCKRSQLIGGERTNIIRKEQKNNDQLSSSCSRRSSKESVESRRKRRRSTSSRRSRSRSGSRRKRSRSRQRSRSRRRSRGCRSRSRRAARSSSRRRGDDSKRARAADSSSKRSTDRKQRDGSHVRSTSPSRSQWRSSKDKTCSRERKIGSDNACTSVSSKADSTLTSSNTTGSHSSTVGRTKTARGSAARMKQVDTERDILLRKWRQSYCATSQEMQEKLEALAKMTPEEILEVEKKVWTRAAPADLFYVTCEGNHTEKVATPLLTKLCDEFYEKLVMRAEKVRSTQEKFEPPVKKTKKKFARHAGEDHSSDSSSNSTDEDELTMEELKRKSQHPYRLHPELWFNDPGEMNDGPLCRCSAKAQRCGIRHGIYSGENNMKRCDSSSNNANCLHHYRITISPPTNFLTKTPTIIKHDGHEFIFEGFSMLSHYPLAKLPTCKVIRFNIEYTILYVEEKLPDNFTVRQLDLFYDFLFREVLELVDLDFKAHGDRDGCPQFHFMPRFVRDLQDNGKEILSMNVVMQYLMSNSRPLFEEASLDTYMKMPQFEWQNFADEIKGMVVTYPGMKPCSLRVDQLDRDQHVSSAQHYPEIVHFGVRPPQLSYAGNPEYQKAWREYVKFRHLLANMPKPSFEDKRKLESKEMKLQEMRTQSRMKRDVTVAVSAKGFHRTGIMCDVVQHAMLIPVLVCHLRFHRSCDTLEAVIDYKFQNRYLLQLALTHPSYRENFGTNPDHARNTLTNCGIRQPEYGDRRIHYMNTRKRGINTLINIMSRFGKTKETGSNIIHNERLEFLGDAVVEFLTSIHLFHMLPNVEEGGLATFRAALVQNQHLAVLAKNLKLDAYMLYAHGSDLCHDLELRHAMANCFEALMGALFLDGGIKVPDKVFGNTKFTNPELRFVWFAYPLHPLQQQELSGDRHWIQSHRPLLKLTEFEEAIGVKFNHIRLLARAFTDRSVGYTNLTQGSNQRLEFLGDTVLQLVASEYLYKYFPEHHEGHLSLLRSSLVNNRTQAVVCNDLGMTKYAVYSRPKVELKTKDRADLLEAFLGALYVDKGLKYCGLFCNVCFFPRLQDFIMNQDWNDPKSKLQQCCLTLRSMDGGEPDIPIYKVIECKGPTNTREYTVAVYFRQKRLAKACGHSIQMAEMNAARKALENSKDLFPQLDHQKRVIAKSVKKQHAPTSRSDAPTSRSDAPTSRSDAPTSRSDAPTSRSDAQNRSEAPSRSDASTSRSDASTSRSDASVSSQAKFTAKEEVKL